MTASERKKKLLGNALLLILAICAVVIITAIAYYFYERFPSYSADGWAGFNDAISILVIGGISLIIAMTGWTLYMVYDMRRNRADKSYLLMNGVLLCLPYLVPVFFLGSRLAEEGRWMMQRNRITTTVENYTSVAVPDSCYIRETELRNDSLLCYATSNKRELYDKGPAFRFSSSPRGRVDGYVEQLNAFYFNNETLTPFEAVQWQSDSLNPDVRILQLAPAPRSVFHHSTGERHSISVVDTLDRSFSDSIPGYREIYQESIYTQHSFKEANGKRWFYFNTEGTPYNMKHLYVACTDGNARHVYRITLHREEQAFNPEHIKGIFKTGKTIVVISDRKILRFDVEN